MLYCTWCTVHGVLYMGTIHGYCKWVLYKSIVNGSCTWVQYMVLYMGTVHGVHGNVYFLPLNIRSLRRFCMIWFTY